jgi:phosphatidylinositol alpha-1,6-mannosyltransferase
MGLENNILFLEKTSMELKNALLNQSDIFLMPSIQDGASVEGFGISFLEASMFKTACIGGKIGGASDIIKHGVTGFLCDGEDQTDIYDALVKMMKKELYKKMGVAAQVYSKNFIWKTQIKKYLKLI